MDQQSQSRRSHVSVIQNLSERVRQVENLASHNYVSSTPTPSTF